jgi:hypothetical protein
MLELNLQSVAYNIFFGFMFFLWLIRDHQLFRLGDRLKNGSLRYIWTFSIIYTPIMTYAVIFIFHSDVNLAIRTAIEGFLTGVNVYDPNAPIKVVEHLLKNGDSIFGVYHYFPPDLFVHTIFYVLFGWLNFITEITEFWFFITNLILLGLLYPLIKHIVKLEHKRLLPMYSVFICHFLMTNSTLMLVFFVIGYYFLQNNKKSVGYTGYIMGASVKYAPGLHLVIHMIEDLRQSIDTRSITNFLPYILGSIILALTMIPFGFFNVIESTILFQGEIGRRTELATIQGPLLIEIMLHLDILDLYNIVFVLSSILALVLSLKMGKNTYEKIMYLQFIMLFLLPFMATELFVVTIFHWFFVMILENDDIDPLIVGSSSSIS